MKNTSTNTANSASLFCANSRSASFQPEETTWTSPPSGEGPADIDSSGDSSGIISVDHAP